VSGVSVSVSFGLALDRGFPAHSFLGLFCAPAPLQKKRQKCTKTQREVIKMGKPARRPKNRKTENRQMLFFTAKSVLSLVTFIGSLFFCKALSSCFVTSFFAVFDFFEPKIPQRY
jgi:hypothetical protein